MEIFLILLLILLLFGGGGVYYAGAWPVNNAIGLIFLIFVLLLVFGLIGGPHYHWW